ncbi:MAG: hypothetical protein Q8896_08720, partial [Bacteroidota bacterium]|nr:hypothetical protein [Bacteroidota bacterium]
GEPLNSKLDVKKGGQLPAFFMAFSGIDRNKYSQIIHNLHLPIAFSPKISYICTREYVIFAEKAKTGEFPVLAFSIRNGLSWCAH